MKKEQIEKAILFGALSFVGSVIAKKLYDKFTGEKYETI